jgi:hypothetical protein
VLYCQAEDRLVQRAGQGLLSSSRRPRPLRRSPAPQPQPS